mgnify:CR=1 FL=1
MNSRFGKYMQIVALLASGVIVVQMILIATKGDAACLNEGCKIVEGLTAIPPLYFNLIGVVYFLSLFAALRWQGAGPEKSFDLAGLLLLAGIGAEGVLVAYQVYVVKALCSYCLFIFFLIVLLNILAGGRQFVRAVTVGVAVNLIFPLLSFGPSLILSRGATLAAGTYASRTCTEPAKELFLIFSENCPHCINVITALESCNSCDFHFNPISEITSLDLPAVIKNTSYSPEVNRIILSLLDIRTVPVLLVKNKDGYSFIKGEKNIIGYVEQACFRSEDLIYFDSRSYMEEEKGMSIYDDRQDECEVTVECDGE